MLNTKTTQNLVTTELLTDHWNSLSERVGFGNTYFSEFMKPFVALHLRGQLVFSTDITHLLKATWKEVSQITAMNYLIDEALKLEDGDEKVLLKLKDDLLTDSFSLDRLYSWHVEYLNEIGKKFLSMFGEDVLTYNRFHLRDLNQPSVTNNIVVPVASLYDVDRLQYTIIPKDNELACMYALGLGVVSVTDPNHAGRIDGVLYFIDRKSSNTNEWPGFYAYDLVKHDFGHINRDSGVPEEYLNNIRYPQKKLLDMAFRLALLEVTLSEGQRPLNFYQSSGPQQFFFEVASGQYLTSRKKVVEILRSRYSIEPIRF